MDPESTSAEKFEESEIRDEVRGTRRELGSERADALRRTSIVAQEEPTQSSTCAEVKGLLSLFLHPRIPWSPSVLLERRVLWP